MSGQKPLGHGITRSDRVLAVIVTFKRIDILREALHRLRQQTRPVDGIVVVDNAATGGAGDMVGSEFRDVAYLAMSDNLGAPAGYAMGMRYALEHGADWVWVFNDDNYTEPGALEACLSVVEGFRAEVGIVAPWHDIGGRIQRGYHWRRGPIPFDAPQTTPYQADLVLLGAALISRSVIERIGYPREDYFIGFWEWEYCLRTRAAGIEIWVSPQVGVVNLAAGSTGSSPPWRLYYQTRNHLRTALDRHSPAEVAWWLGRLTKMLAVGVFGQNKSKGARLRMRLLGGWHGLIGRMGKTIDPETFGIGSQK